MKALFDTNATAYWMAGSPRFHLPLKQLVNELRAQRASLFLSTVSLQEILVFSRTRGTADDDHAFLLERRIHMAQAALDLTQLPTQPPVQRT